MKKNSFKLLAKLTTVATIMSSVMAMTPMANAALITSAKDTMTRLKISTTSDHIVVFTLPTGIDFDSTTQTDFLRVDFANTFTQGGTWVVGDFTFNDGTSRTINAVNAGAGTVDCTVAAGVNNVCVAIDTTNFIFTVKPSSTYTASATAATVTFGVFGTTTTGTGTLTNPSSAGSTSVIIAECDEVAACDSAFASTHSTTDQVSIVDDDQVTVTASVDASITFDLDTGTAANADTAAPYTVALGTITSGAVKSGGDGTINRIGADLSTTASGGAVVTVKSGSATGLCSTSVPGDCIEHNAGGVIAAGTEDYGLCVNTVSATSTVSPWTSSTNFNSVALSATTGTPDTSTTCTSTVHNTGSGTLSTTAQTILSTTQGISAGRAEIFVKAAISAVTPAHSDYVDTLTFVATGTF